jgi:SAM-dependent methyltransferase
MSFALKPIAPGRVSCKCCAAEAPFFGVADFNKNCEEPRNPHVLPLADIPVYYYQCKNCAFVFTTFFDTFTPEDFSQHIYNDQYILVDPDFEHVRPANNAQLFSGIFGAFKNISILDYGGGNGTLERLLKQNGFQHVTTYDPFSPIHATKPGEQFDLIFCFEVFEHSTNPKKTLNDILALLKPSGMLMFSTFVQPDNINEIKTGWWYIGPRNGHVSIHSRHSLQLLANEAGYQLGHVDDNLHLLCREVPYFAQHFLNPGATDA